MTATEPQPDAAPRTAHGLTEAQRAAYARDGFLCPLPVFDAAEIAAHLGRLEALEARMAGRLPPALNAKPHLLLPWLWEMVHDPRILDPVEDLLGPDLLCLATSFISKRGGADDDRYVSWHQDATHWGLSAPRAVTAWVAFTPSRRENGCVLALPGTQDRRRDHADNGDPRNMLGRREAVLEDVDEAAAVALALEPGEMSLHHPLVLHGSAPNRSPARRTGFAIRYIPAGVGLADGSTGFAALVRGRDHGHFEPERPPRAEFDAAAVAHHRAALRRIMSTIFGSAREGPALGT